MLISDIRTEFYDVVSKNWVLLLVSYDVDSLCACKILQYLFQCDSVLYTLIPVHGKSSLISAFRQHEDQAKFVVMINCGSTFDIVDQLQPKDDIIFFVCDTHRPIDVYNIYSDSQVRLLAQPDDGETIPMYDDIFRSSEDEDDNAGLSESNILKRREKRLWEEKRHKIIFDYTQFTYFGLSSALTMFELAWKMSRDTNELLWMAIVGLSEQYLFGKIEQEKYMLSAASLQNHILRHSHKSTDGSDTALSYMKISFEKDLNLSLYRHWSLFESLMHSKYTSCKFKLWSFKGQKKMLEFLAEIGLPLPQCKQKFLAMDAEYRNNVISWIENVSEKYKLNEIIYGSFTSQYGYKSKICAVDVVLAISTLLDSSEIEKPESDKFLGAIDALTKGETTLFQHGIELAKTQLVAVFQQVQASISMNHIVCAGPFLYAIIQDNTPNSSYFSSPGCLSMFAHFLIEANANNSRSTKARTLPLVLVAADEKDKEKCLVIGIPPLAEGSQRNFFGKAFEQLAQNSNIPIVSDLFDSSVIYINSHDKSKFFDALVSMLN